MRYRKKLIKYRTENFVRCIFILHIDFLNSYKYLYHYRISDISIIIVIHMIFIKKRLYIELKIPMQSQKSANTDSIHL